MKIKIGCRYLERLEEIKHFIAHALNRGFQNKLEVVIVEDQGTCGYDRCPDKIVPSDLKLLLRREDGSYSALSFHSHCIDCLTRDKRLRNLN